MERLRDLWCKVIHNSLMWPIHGQYECRACGRRHSISWAAYDERTIGTDPAIFSDEIDFRR